MYQSLVVDNCRQAGCIDQNLLSEEKVEGDSEADTHVTYTEAPPGSEKTWVWSANSSYMSPFGI